MKKKECLLSICITSYKRINELYRCLKSIDTVHHDLVEIVISEDCSPEKDKIRAKVEEYANTTQYSVVFNSNEYNLGYDGNLKKLATIASGEYIFYISDDDCLFPNTLDLLIDTLQLKKPAMVYSPFWYGYDDAKEAKRKYVSSHYITPGEDTISSRVYDAILFSGLTFKREYILAIDSYRFRNLNYIQVYMFLDVLYHHGGYYLNVLTIDSVSDGENAYGQVTSSNHINTLLANRDSIFSNIEFNKGLFKVIKFFDNDHNTNVFSQFSKEYSLRSLAGLCRARKHGLSTYHNYWLCLKESGVCLSWISYIYYIVVLILGSEISKNLFILPRKFLQFIRKHN